MNPFHAWLRSREGAEVISRCIGMQTQNDDDDQPSFWEFLLHTQGRSSSALHALVVREDWEGLRRKIKSMYALFLAEQKRDLLYQRVRQVLHDADATFGYQAGDKFSWYGATTSSAPLVGSYPELQAAGLAFMCPTMDTLAIKTASGILCLAASFRDQLKKYLREDCRIPLRTLCSFIRDHFDVSLVYEQPDRAVSTDNVSTENEDISPAHHENSYNLPAIAAQYICADTLRMVAPPRLSDASLRSVAAAVACQLERSNLLNVMCLLMYCELSMAVAAKALGYAGASGVAAPYHKACALIAEAASLYEGLAEDDLDVDMFRRFSGLLLEACTDVDCSRYSD